MATIVEDGQETWTPDILTVQFKENFKKSLREIAVLINKAFAQDDIREVNAVKDFLWTADGKGSVFVMRNLVKMFDEKVSANTNKKLTKVTRIRKEREGKKSDMFDF